jgi:hypothetical protein
MGGMQCQIQFGGGIGLTLCGFGGFDDDYPRRHESFSVVHEKAVPARIGVLNNQPYHGGTANGRRKDARSPAKASEIVDWIDA